MSKALRATKWLSRSTAWAAQISPPVQRRTRSPGSRTARLPQTGQCVGNLKGWRLFGRSSSARTATICGITSPARCTITVSPIADVLARDLVLVVQRGAGRP